MTITIIPHYIICDYTLLFHFASVCHLAGRLLRALKSHLKPDIINEEDILCVEIAGLCHDLGIYLKIL